MLSRFMTRREQFVLFFIGCAILIGSTVLFLTQRSSDEAVLISDDTLPAVPASTIPESEVAPVLQEEIAVSVQGAVRLPGLYTFTDNQRVNDAVQAAGGFSPNADPQKVNLAARLVDATTLLIPSHDDPETVQPIAAYLVMANSAAVDASIHTETTQGKININTASAQQLESLPGIGPTYARAIIAHRTQAPFRSIDEITEVRGIGPKRYEGIRDQIAVQ